jgi:chaperone modulatory protein CbpM
MANSTIMTGLIVEETLQLTFVEICEGQAIAEDTLFEMLEQGLLEEVHAPHKQLIFQGPHLKRVLCACRLHRDLGINSSGVILALELLDELEDLQQQLQILQRHIER